ncbi:TPA: hypothetical protein N0F65_002411 [Lagenidium giganteum]|uniref:J domain-containing protein n=1 Tax=Lagenidium giganteum TaxID=4803 RepID=A0AAV2YN93_9STRA|nr:TPA: hypothetical protein N0F65_002411 [Lagenidium giganteum]
MEYMSKKAEEPDYYEILGLEPGADERQVAKAYKKKSLLHHPDRGGDVQKFLELKHARDTLLDPKKKEAYDKKLSDELQKKRRQREREAEMDAKQRQMVDKLLRKERNAQQTTSTGASRTEINKLRERGFARQQELREQMLRDARRREELRKFRDGEQTESAQSKANRTVSLKWDNSICSHSDDSICQELRSFGEIESVKVKSSSAKVLFRTTRAALDAVRSEGHNSRWRSFTLLGHIQDDVASEPTSTATAEQQEKRCKFCVRDSPISIEDHDQFETAVLERLRRTFWRNFTHTDGTAGVQFDVRRRAEKCLSDEVAQGSLVVIHYNVIGTQQGKSGVSIVITDPLRKYLKQDSNIDTSSDDIHKFSFHADAGGSYSVCFFNSNDNPVRVMLDFKHGVEAKDYTEVAKREHLMPVEKELRKMEDTVDEIHREMLYMREREAAMRSTNESTNSRVLWFSFLSIVVLLAMGVWQVFYLKKFFKSKKLI